MKLFTVRLITFLLVVYMVGACQTEKVDPVANASSYNLTQAHLDSATLVFRNADLNITGAPFGNRDNDSTRLYIREIYSNVPAGQKLKIGSVVAIRAYEKVNNKKGKLKLIDVMVCRENSYNNKGGHFEYMWIKYDAATDYAKHPNGLLPSVLQANSRGTDLQISLESCVSCHRKAPRDTFIFSRNL